MVNIPFPNVCGADCQKRTVTCKFDGSCDTYQNAKKAHLALKSKVYEQRRAEYIARDFEIESGLKRSGRNRKFTAYRSKSL